MANLIVVKCINSEWSKEGRIQGTLDIPFSDKNEEGVLEIKKEIPETIDGVFSGPQSCCVTTAKKLDKGEVKILQDLIDINFGIWQGLKIEEIKKKHPKAFKKWKENPCGVEILGGERIEDASKRVLRCIGDILRKVNGNILIVVPPNIAALIKINFEDLELKDIWKIRDTMKNVETIPA